MRSRRRGVGHDHVLFGTKLQEALDPCGRVVRTLAFVAVGQHEHQGGTLAPLLLGRGDELIDDGLRAVDEVAELRFPQHQCIGALHGVSVFEAHRSVFGQQGVVDPQLGLVIGEVAQGQPFIAVGAVVEHGVALHEGSAAGILACEPDRNAFHDERAKGCDLAEAPVDAAFAGHLFALLQQLLELGVDREALGDLDVGLADARQGLCGDRSGRGCVDAEVRLLGAGPFDVGHCGGIRRDDRDR
ncbi:hypothetical protein D9M72_515080 [compost metagenome]